MDQARRAICIHTVEIRLNRTPNSPGAVQHNRGPAQQKPKAFDVFKAAFNPCDRDFSEAAPVRRGPSQGSNLPPGTVQMPGQCAANKPCGSRQRYGASQGITLTTVEAI
jgi:hypothetical protein